MKNRISVRGSQQLGSDCNKMLKFLLALQVYWIGPTKRQYKDLGGPK